jgi:hypothetical protein
VLALLAATTQRGEAVALVDLGDHLDPQAAATAGVDLQRLLWARPTRLRDALAAAEIALGGGFPLVVLELGSPPLRGRRDEHAWLRLARACRHHRGALLVATPYRLTGSAAGEVLALSRHRGVWLGGGPSGDTRWRDGRAPRLLAGVDSRLHREKSRREPEPATAALSWRSPLDLSAPAEPAVEPARQPAARPALSAAAPATPPAMASRRVAAPRLRSRPRRAAPAARPAALTRAVAAAAAPPPAPRQAQVPGWVPLARAALAEVMRGQAPPPRGRA